MKKTIKQNTILMLVVLMVICFCMGAFFVQKEFAAAEEGVQNDTAIVENQVLVTLTKEETRKFLDYSAEDFQEIGAKSVEDLTAATADWVEKKV